MTWGPCVLSEEPGYNLHSHRYEKHTHNENKGSRGLAVITGLWFKVYIILFYFKIFQLFCNMHTVET